ncbi:hypothetical protein O0I10_010862 [Lichtheimia ornata]|uniref:DUF676 domain-containing protein n=1 Tax=Lichtheimia ornata TaxID=688661 RepID=A0AAD7UVE8_9FUNG|nr:uncharacterized protein O0I10_010862 [Lichtheimia ornata]KAJ8653534.1 hypothetical protein O0I10_010862 [Lichtheimia ornata]
MTQVTLIVLQHGLWGNKNHMRFIRKAIEEACDASDAIDILNVDINEGKYTYDGIDVCGERLAQKIRDRVDELDNNKDTQVEGVIMVGYSLGGLMLRYAIGVLGKSGFFDNIKPLLYVTFATPHLGVRREPKSTFLKFYNYITGHILSRTGEQLQLLDDYQDGSPILSVLADPKREFHQYLSRFKQRRTYANVANDRTVPYWTAAMEITNHFEIMKDLDISVDSTYSSIITAFDLLQHDEDKNDDSTMTATTTRSVHPSKKRKRSKDGILVKCLLVIFSPLLPVVALLAFLYIGSQGLMSRLRVARLLAASSSKKTQQLIQSETIRRSSKSNHSTILEEENQEILVDTLDATNIPTNPSPAVNMHQETTKKRSSLYNVMPSERITKVVQPMALSAHQIQIQKHLDQLEWERVLVYIRGFNAHASIVCRERRFVNDGGRAAIQHFVDTLFAAC